VSQRRNGCLGGGCLTLFVGLLLGVVLTLVTLFLWGLLRPADRAPLNTGFGPQDLDLEMTVSEAFLNRAVTENLAASQTDDPVSIILDVHRGGKVEAILEGLVRVGGLAGLSPTVDAEVWLGVEDGGIVVRIERVGIGALKIGRDTLPSIVQPAFESMEEATEQALNEQLLGAGYRILSIETDEGSLTLGLQQQ
jgi:hypothetical protein